MDHAAAFRSWVLDPARTSDELHLAELLVEAAEDLEPYERARYRARQDALKKRCQKRALDPAYRPRFTRARLDAALEHWPRLTNLKADHADQRPVRDLSALRFAPTLGSVDLRTRLRTLDGLACLPALRSLAIEDERLTDLSILRRLPRLESVSLRLSHPWPDPAGLEALTACRTLRLSLAPLVAESVPAWPALEELDVSHYRSYPLRDFRRLPAMPALRRLKATATDLAGLERYPTLERLELDGIYADLAPLAGLPRLRELALRGEDFEDLAPLARLPELRQLTLHRERGLLLDPLLEAPRLRRVLAPGNRVIATELASINAAIGWGDDDFLVETPRPLRSLRFFTYQARHPEIQAARAVPRPPEPSAEVADGDPTFGPAEVTCVRRHLRAHLDATLGPGWGRLAVASSIHLELPRARERRESLKTLEAVRGFLARLRYPWKALIIFGKDHEDFDSFYEERGDFEPMDVYVQTEEEVEDQRRRAREKRLRLEREHLLRLQDQGLAPAQPAEAEPADDTPPPFEDIPGFTPDGDAEEDDEDNDADEEANKNEDSEDDEWSELPELDLHLTETEAWISSSWLDEARALLRLEPEDWHALPEPPEQRPRPE